VLTEAILAIPRSAGIYSRAIFRGAEFSRPRSESIVWFMTDVTDHSIYRMRARGTSIYRKPVTSVMKRRLAFQMGTGNSPFRTTFVPPVSHAPEVPRQLRGADSPSILSFCHTSILSFFHVCVTHSTLPAFPQRLLRRVTECYGVTRDAKKNVDTRGRAWRASDKWRQITSHSRIRAVT
jgi:hypothetical protein